MLLEKFRMYPNLQLLMLLSHISGYMAARGYRWII